MDLQNPQQQQSDNQWKYLDNVINDLESDINNNQDDEENEIIKLAEVAKKLKRLKDLKQNVEKDENELKLQYILLMRERNVYFEKLKMIQSLGDNSKWQDDSGLLNAVKNLLSNLGDNQNNKEQNNSQQINQNLQQK